MTISSGLSDPVDLKALSGKLMESAFIELRLDRFNYVHDLLKAIYSIVPMQVLAHVDTLCHLSLCYLSLVCVRSVSYF